MFAAYLVVGTFLALIATVSGVGKLTGLAQVTDTLTKVGVPARIWPVLAGLEFAGAAGLVLGYWVWPIGAAAALGLLLYFAGAVIAHFRAGDHAIAPPTVLALVGAAVLVLRLSST